MLSETFMSETGNEHVLSETLMSETGNDVDFRGLSLKG